MGIDIFCYAVNRSFSFPGIGAKQVIENDKDASHIFIDVLRIYGMVHPVIGRCIKYPIQYA